MKKYNIAIVFLLAFLWITTQSVNCRRPIINDSCSTYKNDSVYFKIDVTNQTSTFALVDTIKIYSKISDNITPLVSSGFVFPLNSLSTTVQIYKVVPIGSTYQLNYANVEFNLNIQTGTINPYQGIGYNLVYNRNQPNNELSLTLKPGVVGLYAVVFDRSYYNYDSNIRNPNDNCVSFTNVFTFNTTNQNLQYWNTLGTSTLNLANSNGNFKINKNDKNYFFVKVIP